MAPRPTPPKMTKSDWSVVAELAIVMAEYYAEAMNFTDIKDRVRAGSLVFEGRVSIETGSMFTIRNCLRKIKAARVK